MTLQARQPRRLTMMLLLALSGCGGGALEDRVVYKDVGGPFFSCEDNSGNKNDDSEHTYHYWVGLECADLGYTKKTSTSAIFNAAGSNIPGKCGQWGDKSASCAGGGSGSSSLSFTCSSGNVCVEYTLPTQARYDQLRGQCAAPGSGSCSRTGAKTCRHTNASGDVSCTVTSSPPASHDADCSGTGGTTGC